jgi:hypothetical protein
MELRFEGCGWGIGEDVPFVLTRNYTRINITEKI